MHGEFHGKHFNWDLVVFIFPSWNWKKFYFLQILAPSLPNLNAYETNCKQSCQTDMPKSKHRMQRLEHNVCWLINSWASPLLV